MTDILDKCLALSSDVVSVVSCFLQSMFFRIASDTLTVYVKLHLSMEPLVVGSLISGNTPSCVTVLLAVHSRRMKSTQLL